MKMFESQIWLYTQGDESIRIIRDVTGVQLLVCGPGPAEHAHTFDSKTTLQDFFEWYGAHLAADGWILERTVERRGERAVGPIVPPTTERRRRM
jgi:hypothetical protein